MKALPSSLPTRHLTRRSFLGRSALGGAGILILRHPGSARSAEANERLNVAAIGVGGQGRTNIDQVAAFLAAHPDFQIEPYAKAWEKHIGGPAPASTDGRSDSLLLTPASHGTDGFFIAILERRA